ncbi:MAG TPA: DUF4178 domain-containing protein, partial [Byssovorax sp.]
MASPLDKQATCPNCGAPLTFRFAGAKAQVCEHCRFVVARTGDGLSVVGQVAELVEIASPLVVGATGRWHDEAFAVEGRVQFDRAGAPGAPWQEHLISFPASGRWVWVAAAQGRWYVTSQVDLPPGGVPHWRSLRPGREITIGSFGAFTVAEVGQRRVVSAEGAMPHVAAPGQITRFVDVGGANGGFGTIDYGDDEKVPAALFLGKQFDPAELKLDSGAPVELPEAKVAALACPSCGGNLPLVTPGTTERVVCRYCGTSSDFTKGALVALKQEPKPPRLPEIPLGATGKLRGSDVTCIGFMGRACTVDGGHYPWREYLLYAGPSTGYLWLMEEDGNWSFVRPLPPGTASISGSSATLLGDTYRWKQSVRAVVEYVVGEFYWRVEAGEAVQATEYSGRDGILSVEEADTEINLSMCERLPASELEGAFGVNLGGATSPPDDDAPGADGDGAMRRAGRTLGQVLFV